MERAVFVAEQAGVDADALVVLDEFGSNLDLTRRFGRSKRGTRLEAIIAARGCRIWYLPPHSPDFSPIELAFAKVKGELRRLKARTTEALERAIALALSSITGADARAFFAHCGYPLWPIRDQ